MFNQKKIDDLTDRLNKSGNEVQRLQNEIKKLKGETMAYTSASNPEDRIRKFLNAAARLIPEFSDVSSSIDFHYYYYDNPLALLDVFTERFTKTADAKEEKERVKKLVKEILAEQCKDAAQSVTPATSPFKETE